MNLQTTAPESAQQPNEPKKLYTVSSSQGLGQVAYHRDEGEERHQRWPPQRPRHLRRGGRGRQGPTATH